MIVIYVHALAATGVVRNARLLAADLAGHGHAVQLVTALPGGEGVPGVRHHPLLKSTDTIRLLEKLRAGLALRRHLRAVRADTLISAGNHGHATAWLGSRGVPRLRRIYRISNDILRAVPGAPAGRLQTGWRRAMAWLVAADATHLVLVSPTLAETPTFSLALRQGHATVIANGIDAPAARLRAQGPPPHAWLDGLVPVIVGIGRLAAQKNFETLLAAFALLRRDRPARLIILGEGRDGAHARLMALAMSLEIADDMALPGTVANVFPWLAHADAFALPSWWEGSANVLLEAMAVGTPCVASHSAGNAAQLLDGGRDGLLVDPADPHAMAQALGQQIDPARAIRPGDRIEAFTLKHVADGWRDLIERLRAG